MEAFGYLSKYLNDACNERQLPDPFAAVDEKQNNNIANSATYIKALSSWLVSLGYLEEDFLGVDRINEDIKNAVNRFQREAGFVDGEVDSWAGPKTKQRLQCLVSFEYGQDMADWGNIAVHPEQYPAVSRAVYLRLYTLGFLDDHFKINKNTIFDLNANANFHHALSNFLLAVQQLGLTKNQLTTDISSATLAVLFGQDNLILALSKNNAFIADPANSAFVRAIGWIELWLLGYDVNLATHKYDDQVLQVVVNAFKKNHPGKKILNSDKVFSSDFFSIIESLTNASSIDNKYLERTIIRHKDSLIDKMKKLATGVWDGIKRLWSWFKNKIGKLLNLLENEIWGLARLLSNSARKSYELCLKALDIVHRGSVYLRKNVFPGSDLSTSLLQFDAGFDANFFLNSHATGKDTLVDSDSKETKYFVVSCQIFALLNSTLIDVTKIFVAGAAGWFVLIISLARIKKQLYLLNDIVGSLDAAPLEIITAYPNPVK